ncbi:MAG TPA: hypothetical protein VM848_00075 [Acidimicrobiia bacterium]|nr:hypothetical protein [Acidimicrobiia bacterium]
MSSPTLIRGIQLSGSLLADSVADRHVTEVNRLLLNALMRLHPLGWGLMVGGVIYLSMKAVDVQHLLSGLCVDCWVSAVDDPGVVGALGAAGASVGSKAGKDFIEKKAGKGPLFAYKDMYDIASKDTPKEQAEEAWSKYKGLIMTEHAPPGSLGDEINKTIDKFFDFHKDGIDLGGGDDDDP